MLKICFYFYYARLKDISSIIKGLISYETRATKTSAYQEAKLGPLSWEMNNSFDEKMLSVACIRFIMYSAFYTFYITIYLYQIKPFQVRI